MGPTATFGPDSDLTAMGWSNWVGWATSILYTWVPKGTPTVLLVIPKGPVLAQRGPFGSPGGPCCWNIGMCHNSCVGQLHSSASSHFACDKNCTLGSINVFIHSLPVYFEKLNIAHS